MFQRKLMALVCLWSGVVGGAGSMQGQGAPPVTWTAWAPASTVTASSLTNWAARSVYISNPISVWYIRVDFDVRLDAANGCSGTPVFGDVLLSYCHPVGENVLFGNPNRLRIRLVHQAGTHPVLWRNVRIGTTPQCFAAPAATVEWGRDGSGTSCPTYGPQGLSQMEFAFNYPQSPPGSAPFISVVDANDPAFLCWYDVTADPEALCTGGQARTGAVADGESRLLIRVRAPSEGTVLFEHLSWSGLAAPVNGEDGSIAPPGTTAPLTAFASATSSTSQGPMAYAIYRPPRNFVQASTGSAQSMVKRMVSVRVTFTPNYCTGSGVTSVGGANLWIHRVPVVLCHGLWASPCTWSSNFEWYPFYNLNALSQGPRNLFKANYYGTRAASFTVNEAVVGDAIYVAKRELRLQGIACTQVDWVGHSMGGLLPRVYYRKGQMGLACQNGFYRGPDNFGAGDLHKLITITTPHFGSPWANVIDGIRQQLAPNSSWSQLWRHFGMPIDLGAIEDLKEGSPAIMSLGETYIPTHAIYATGGDNLLGSFPLSLSGAARHLGFPRKIRQVCKLTSLQFGALMSAFYRALPHDLVVLAPSQIGGLPVAATWPVPGQTPNHLSVTSDAQVAAHVKQMLEARLDTGNFVNPIPAPSASSGNGSSWPPAGSGPSPAYPGQIVISPPVQGLSVVPGQVVNVPVAYPAGFVPQFVDAYLGGGIDVEFTGAPFQVAIPIPLIAAGTTPVWISAETATGQRAVSNTLNFQVNPAATASLFLPVAPLRFTAPREVQQLVVMAVYSDAVPRDVTRTVFYGSNNPSIVSVTGDGLVTAVNAGSTGIYVSIDAINMTIPVTVEFAAVMPYAEVACSALTHAPILDSDGQLPHLGNANFRIRAHGLSNPGAGVAAFAFQAASIPAGNQSILIPWTTAIYAPLSATMVPGAPFSAEGVLPVPIPTSPIFEGAVLFVQAAFSDPVASGGIRLTSGLRVTIIP